MPDSATRATRPEGSEIGSPDEPAAAVTPPPEPWTPERVLAWNRYYDYYLVAALLLLVFISAAHPIINASLWTDLQTGRLIADRGPVTRDPFSYTMKDQPWANIPWAFQTISAKIWDIASSFRAENGDRLAAATLVVLTGLIRVLTALLLLKVRRAGPGLWWSVICVTLALGAVFRPMPGSNAPLSPVMGGIAQWAEVDSSTWGLLFLSVEILLLYRAYTRGCHRTLLVLVPLFLLWANVDESFLFGLVTLALWVIGSFVMPRKEAPVTGEAACGPVSLPWALGILAACVLVCLANPALFGVYPAAARQYTELARPTNDVLTVNQLSFFGPKSQDFFNRIHGGPGSGAYRFYIAYYALAVGAGLVSFILNRRRFSLPRFLVFAWAALVWAALASLSGEFAVIWAAILALNGQEWFHDTFGVAGSTSSGWRLWSVGGRAITLLLLSLMIVKGLTGYAATPGEPSFGFTVNVDDFAFESAEYLAKAPIQGNVLNLTLANGDALIWRAWPINPDRKTFIDGRDRLFSTVVRDELQTVRQGLVDSDSAAWRPILDKYNISTVMVPTSTDPGAERIYEAMKQSGDWVPFYDDGSVVLLGRADAPEADLAYFEANRLEAPRLAFLSQRDVPSSDAIPSESALWFDRVFQNRFSKTVQPHVWAAQRWLSTGLGGAEASPEPARCLLAVGEARTALARNPNDPAAWRMLNEAYRLLTLREGQILAESSTAGLPEGYYLFRFRQRVMAINYAIESTPPPRSPEARAALADLHLQLGELYESMNYLDLALENLKKARELLGPAKFPQELEARTAQLELGLQTVRDQVDQSLIDQQTSPINRADFALNQGAPALAIEQLEAAESYGMPAASVKARLLDLYMQVGRPDKAIALFSTGDVEDPALSTGPGSSSYRQGLVYMLIGSYDTGSLLWKDRAIQQLRATQSMQGLEAARLLLLGNLPGPGEGGVIDTFLDLPNQVDTQAAWQYQLGLMLLEAGQPEAAAEALTTTLELNPDSPLRPLLAYYLEQMGKPVPPPKETPEAVATPPAAAAGKPEAKKPTTTTLPADIFAPAP